MIPLASRLLSSPLLTRAGPFARAISALLGGSIELATSRRYLFGTEPIVYPPDILAFPHITLTFQEYRRNSIRENPFYEDAGQVRLPLPSNLIDGLELSYEQNEIGPLLGSVLEAMSGSMRSRGEASLTESVLNRAGEILNGVAGQVGSAAEFFSGDVGRLFKALTGVTTNPFPVVLFRSPNFKSHTFTWTFVPKNPNESNILRNLIKMLQFHSLPGVSSVGPAFFFFPEIVRIAFYPPELRENLYKFKPCVIEGVGVNYAPAGISFTAKSEYRPTAVSIEMKLSEIEIWTKEDFIRNIPELRELRQQTTVRNELPQTTPTP